MKKTNEVVRAQEDEVDGVDRLEERRELCLVEDFTPPKLEVKQGQVPKNRKTVYEDLKGKVISKK